MSENQELNGNAQQQLVARAGDKCVDDVDYVDESITIGPDGAIQDVAIPPHLPWEEMLKGDQSELVRALVGQLSPDLASMFVDGNRMCTERVLRTLNANGRKESKEAAEQRKKDEDHVEVVLSERQLADIAPIIPVLGEHYGATITSSEGKLIIAVMPMNKSFVLKVISNPRFGKFLVAVKDNLDVFKEATLLQRAYLFGTYQNEIMLDLPLGSTFGICANLAESSAIAINPEAISPFARTLNDLAEKAALFDGRDDEDYDPESGDTKCTGQRASKKARFLDTSLVTADSSKFVGISRSIVNSQGGLTKIRRLWNYVSDGSHSYLRHYPLPYVTKDGKLAVGGFTCVKTSDRVQEGSSQINLTLTTGLMGVVAKSSMSAEANFIDRLRTLHRFEKHPQNVNGNSVGYRKQWGGAGKDWRREKHIFVRPGFTPYDSSLPCDC